MGNTPLGIAFPDDDDPIDVTESIKETAESVDDYLTPKRETIALADPFANTLILTKVGPLVVLTGGVQRQGQPAAGSVVIGTLPPGFAPQSEAGTIVGTAFGTNTTYQLLVRPNGDVLFRLSAATGNTMHVALTWATA
ncbi:hypothetical protein [Nocardioides alkalitolerans]|uniref:hypothetical protein n=1 Tax=Nocardioides alkalitolerans TaxID=281714 RepID=UPI00042A1074|nr:hypothetical protein [Nocardioides alkalitolerans]